MKQPAAPTKDTRAKKRSRLLALPVTAMVALTALSAVDSRAGADMPVHQHPSRQGRIVMYVQDAPDLSAVLDAAQGADQINYAFASIEDGLATLDHAQGLKEITRFLRDHPHVDGLLSVGGWGEDGFTDACATDESRAALAESILRLMDEHGFVGVDIDWEYPTAAEAEPFYGLLALLRQGLDARQEATGRDHLLSVALGASDEQLESLDGARIAELVDQAVVMAYDLRGFDRLTGHHAGLYPDSDTRLSAAWVVDAWLADGLPEGKLLLGMPLYGRVWRQVSGGTGLHRHAATSGNRTVTQQEIAFLLDSGAARHWDEGAQAAYLYDGENFVSYEDEQSARAKADWLADKGLLGAALWCANQDTDAVILHALDDALTVDPATPTDVEGDV